MSKSTAPKIGEPARRIDGQAKAEGSHVYPSDYMIEGMLRLKILRAAHPHARIVAIDTSRAQQVPGVVGIFTAKDIPGKNAVGVVSQDMPVLCGDIVRCVGDAVAVVAAETEEAARRAQELVEVEYELLPVVTDVRQAMRADAPKIHPDGNILSEIHSGYGDVENVFVRAEHIFENEYITGRQEHAPLETEAGAAFYDDAGCLTVRCGGQYPHRDQQQIAEFLGLQEQQVRVLTPMVGGSFGGKDDFTVQCHLALVTHLTGRPCYIMLDRDESIRATTKRHPFITKYKIACDSEGKLLAAELCMIADTGAHASWGEMVLHVSRDACLGPYYIPNVKLDAYSVYTNNCVSGAFRGFGALQGSVGIESEMDRIARTLGLDPIELRRKNGLQPGQPHPGGVPFNAASVSLNQVLREIENSPLYTDRDALKTEPSPQSRWKKRGIGVSATMMGIGFGHGNADCSVAHLSMTEAGRYRLSVGGVDMGQGNATAYAQIVAKEMSCAIENVEVDIGDSVGPDSGSSDSVRSMYIISNAIVKAAKALRFKIVGKVAVQLSCEPGKVVLQDFFAQNPDTGQTLMLQRIGQVAAKGEVRIYQENPEDNTDDYNASVFTYGAQAALVEVDLLTGKVSVLKIHSAVDAGKVINKQGFEGQSEGGIAQSIGYTLMEDCLLEKGDVLNASLSTYVAPYIIDIPDEIRTIAVEDPDPQTYVGAKGIAEIVMCPTPSAIINAIYDAIGERFTRIPITPERVLTRLSNES